MKLEKHKLFDDKSDLYEKARPIYPENLYQHLSNLCSIKSKVWDCACGNGQAAISLANYFDEVIATDISEKQIENAKSIENVQFIISRSEKTNFPDNSFDLICVAQALHWFDFNDFWPEVKRVLKPNGVFSAWGYTWPMLPLELDLIFKDLILNVIEPYWAPQNKLLLDHYKDIDFPFRKVDSPSFAMAVNWNLQEFFNFIHTFSATRRCMEKEGTEFFDKAYTAMETKWGVSEERKNIDFEFVFYAGIMKQ